MSVTAGECEELEAHVSFRKDSQMCLHRGALQNLERTVGPNVAQPTTGDTAACYSLSDLSEITARRFTGEMQLATQRKTITLIS